LEKLPQTLPFAQEREVALRLILVLVTQDTQEINAKLSPVLEKLPQIQLFAQEREVALLLILVLVITGSLEINVKQLLQ
jgi:hypothetical protein